MCFEDLPKAIRLTKCFNPYVVTLYQECGRGGLWKRTVGGSQTQSTLITAHEPKGIHLEHILAHTAMRMRKLNSQIPLLEAISCLCLVLSNFPVYLISLAEKPVDEVVY